MLLHGSLHHGRLETKIIKLTFFIISFHIQTYTQIMSLFVLFLLFSTLIKGNEKNEILTDNGHFLFDQKDKDG